MTEEEKAAVAMAFARAAAVAQAAPAAAAAQAAAAARAAAVAAGEQDDDDDDYDDLPSVEDKRAKRGFSKRVTLRDLERYFEYPIEEVSKMMGVSTTIIKRLCRKYGIKRWPYRQVSVYLVL